MVISSGIILLCTTSGVKILDIPLLCKKCLEEFVIEQDIFLGVK